MAIPIGHLAMLIELERGGSIGGGAACVLRRGSQLLLPVGGRFLFLEQHREIESGFGVAALLGPAESGLGAGPVALLGEQHTEVGGGGGMASTICAAVSHLGAGKLPFFLK
jgi:hypothetical protein